jgi:acyl-CoA-binding protein
LKSIDIDNGAIPFTVKDSLQLPYEDRVQLLAYYKQEKYGMYTPDKDSDVGYFDVVGRHRRKKWQDLRDMSQEEVQRKFTELIDSVSNNVFKETALQKIAAEEEEERRHVLYMVLYETVHFFSFGMFHYIMVMC